MKIDTQMLDADSKAIVACLGDHANVFTFSSTDLTGVNTNVAYALPEHRSRGQTYQAKVKTVWSKKRQSHKRRSEKLNIVSRVIVQRDNGGQRKHRNMVDVYRFPLSLQGYPL